METEGRPSPPEIPRVAIQPLRRVRPSAVRRFALVIGGFMAFNLLATPIVMQGGEALLASAFLGGVLAQAGLIAIWAALGSAVYWPVRQLQAMLLALLACSCLCIGAFISEGGGSGFRNLAVVLAFAPLTMLAAQLPLLACWMIRGWRIAPSTADHAVAHRGAQQFGMPDLLLAVVTAAVPLGFVRLGFWLQSGDLPPGETAIFVAGVTIISAFLTPPVAWSALGVKDHGAGCGAIVLYSFALMLVIFLVPAMAGGGSAEAFFLAMATLFAATGTMHLILLVFWDCDYRLQSCSPRSIAPELAKSDATNPGEA